MTGEQVKNFRERANLTQVKLAGFMYLSQQSISMIESGITKLTRRNVALLEDIARAVNVPLTVADRRNSWNSKRKPRVAR